MAARPTNWKDVSGEENVQTHLHGPGFFRPVMKPEGAIKRLEKQSRNDLEMRQLDFTKPYTP